MWAAFIMIASIGGASGDIYIFPEAYEHGDGLGAAVNEEALAKLIEENSVDGDEEGGVPSVWHRIDLNNDGKAEIFLAPTQVESYHADWFDIFVEREGQYEEIGSCANGFSLLESKNGYARILNIFNVGERTNPTWNIAISAYDGTKYIAEYESDLTASQMEVKGIDAYHAKDYAVAETWFLNLIRSGLGSALQHENNLALVLFRMKRYQESVERLEIALEAAPPLDKDTLGRDAEIAHRANAHYNLGKAYEALKDMPAAWKNYHAACKLIPTDDRKATLKRLIDLGVDTEGYEVIW